MFNVLKLPRVMLAAVLFAASLIASLSASADVAIPPLRTRVTDLTATLSADQAAALESKLAAFEQKKGSQIAVLLVPTTKPETIEQYSIRVVDQWKLGRRGVDDGVLLLIAKQDRALRIEVGRGLEGVIPDAYGKRIVADEIAPRFKQGDFSGGINAGVDRVIKLVDGEGLPVPAQVNRGASSDFDIGSALIWGGVLVLFVGGILRRIFGRFFGSIFTGGIAGGTAFVLGAGVAGGAILGVIVFVISLIGISMLGSGGFRGGGGGWPGGGGGGGWSGGGGGGFSGGGASGNW
jgi:uncharacterized protein